MPERPRARLRRVALFTGCTAFSLICLLGQAGREGAAPSPATRESLRRFLQTLYDDKAAQYIEGFCDLDGDGTPEAIVYLISQNLCGSGGCNTLILSRRADTW